MFWTLVGLSSCIKLLCIPSYTSTDFEVHRNWLAITNSLPVSQWYTDTTSPWTLDYPPLFAIFEYILSWIAQYFDKDMLNVNNLNYKSNETLIFQRLSVIVTDLVFAYATKQCTNYLARTTTTTKKRNSSEYLSSPITVIQILLLFNTGLFFIDHIHFQYNGFLFGIMLLSIVRILEGRYYEGSFWFAVLLNLKHIFIYIAPAYFIYLLRNHCFLSSQPLSIKTFSPIKFIKLGATVLFVFLLSFGPFVKQLPQVFSRLFPFDDRGLCHAYWAPNFWAFYNSIDKIASIVGKKLNLISKDITNTMSKGLVQNFDHVVLPSITPMICLSLTLLGTLPICWKLWRSPGNPIHFVRCIVLCAATSFVFGWHVHEKAILVVIIPLTLLVLQSQLESSLYLFLSTIGYFSLFPLLFQLFELPTKTFLFLLYIIYSFGNIAFNYSQNSNIISLQNGGYKFFPLPLLNKLESFYILNIFSIYIFDNFIIYLFNIKKKFPFLNLLIISLYCSIGVLYFYIKCYLYFIKIMSTQTKKKIN